MGSMEELERIKREYNIEDRYYKNNSKFFSLADLKACRVCDGIRINVEGEVIEGQMYEIDRITNDEIILNKKVYPSLVLDKERYHRIVIPFDRVRSIVFDYHR